MPGSGTRNFLDPDHYEASLRQAQIELVITSLDEFKARLTWAELHQLQLLRCEEDLPRIGYLSLSPRLVFVAFPSGSGPLPVWRGAQLEAGDVMFHSRGERLLPGDAGALRLEPDSIGPGAARELWPGSLRKTSLYAACRQNLAARPARCGAPAAPACAGLPPR
jgi:hypothetical protein